MQGENPKSINRKVISNRSFAWILAAIAFIFACRFYIRQQNTLAVWLFAISGLLLLIGWLFPTALTWLNRAWFVISGYIASVFSPLILGLIYFLILLPTAGIKRLFTKSKTNQNSSFHQVHRSLSLDDFKNQF